MILHHCDLPSPSALCTQPTGTLIVSTLPPIQSVPLVRTPATEGLEEVVAASAEAQRQALVTELEGLAAR
jgi:hypothetical protein